MRFLRRKSVSDAYQNEFIELIRRHSSIINKICFYYSSDADDFKDMRQDVVVNLWDSQETFRGESKISTWIYRITLNTCISSFQKRKRRGISVPIDSLLDFESDDTSVVEQYRIMHEMIARLSHKERAVILLRLDGADYDTISEVTGICRNTVATLLRRAKQKLIKMGES